MSRSDPLHRIELWIAVGLLVLFAALSAFGFINAFYLRHHGPGIDLGVVAGILALGAYLGVRSIRRNP